MEKDYDFEMMAYEESLKSRKDADHGETDPVVGAILVDEKGKILGKAHRAQLFEGEHAEFSLLKEVAKSDSYAGCTLYTTLEPCTSFSRHTTESCSEIIASSQISRVVIGMVDPNPKVAYLGMRFLLEHGKIVQMFDKGIAKKVEKSNAEYSKGITGRGFETKFVYDEVLQKKMDQEAVKYYLTNNKLAELDPELKVDDDLSFIRMLFDRNLITFDKRSVIVNEEVKMAFYKRLSYLKPNAIVRFIDKREAGSEKPGFIVRKPLIMATKILDDAFDKWGIKPKNYLLIKEAFINAVFHRDYDNPAFTEVSLEDGGATLRITNPTAFSKEKLDEIAEYNTIPEPVNPWLVELGKDVRIIELEGRGLATFSSNDPKPVIDVRHKGFISVRFKLLV